MPSGRVQDPRTKEIFIHLAVGSDGDPVIVNGLSATPQTDVVSAGHERIRWTPVWTEQALYEFGTHPGQPTGFLPQARITACTLPGDAVPGLLEAQVPPASVVEQRWADASFELTQPLSRLATLTGPATVEYTLTLEYRKHPPATGLGSRTWNGTLQFDARPGGTASEAPGPAGGHLDGDTQKILVLVERDGEGHPSVVWNSGGEIDAVADGARRVTWFPVRTEGDFLRTYTEHMDHPAAITSPGTMITGVTFADEAKEDAGRVFLPGSTTDPYDGSLTADLHAPVQTQTGAQAGELSLKYTLHFEEESHRVHSDWDPTIKVKPRAPGLPPAPPPS